MKKKILALILALAMVLPLCPVFELPVFAATDSEFAGGSGTETNPYLIATKEHLNNVRNHLSAHYKMVADIVFADTDFSEGGTFFNNGAGWQPIGSSPSNAFMGTFDGAGHSIKGLKINLILSETLYAGLFGKVQNASFSNIVLVDANIASKGNYACVGGIAGYATATSFDSCEVSGTISSSDDAGGIVGYLESGRGAIKNCHNSSTVLSSNSGGGIAGATGVAVSNCTNSGNISSINGSWSGGIVGYLYSGGSIIRSYNTGNIRAVDNRNKQGSPTTYAGGICGDSMGSSITDCFNMGTIQAEDVARYAFAGGIAGSAKIYNCYNIGNVSSVASTKYYAAAGGIVGDFNQATTNCYYVNTINKGAGRGTSSAVQCTLEELTDVNTFIGFSFKNTWEFKENNHYRYPTLITNPYVDTAHTYDNTCDTTCNNCEAERTPPHTYDNACDTICNECEAERAVPDHVYDNTCDTTCNECEFLRAITHNFSVQDKDETNHWMKCSVCGVEDANSVSNHAYDNACDSTCDECGYTRTFTHNYSVQDKNAETHWMKCSICGAIDETTRETHKYDNACDTNCNICGQIRTITHIYDDEYDPLCNVCEHNRATSFGKTGDCDWYLIGTTLVISGNGPMGDYGYYDNIAPWKNLVTTVIIKNGVTTIGNCAFNECNTLTSVTLSNSITKIGDYAFCYTKLTDINIPSSVISIGCSAFEGCYALKSVTINDGVKTIGNGAFALCFSLNCVAFTKSVQVIEEYAFRDYTATVWYGGTDKDREKITFGQFNPMSSTDSTWHYDSCLENPGSEKVHIYDNACDPNCNFCSTERIPHIYDNACDTTCNECNAERTITHDYSVQDKNAEIHWMKCSVCGVADESSREAHTYDNACDTTCDECGFTRAITHNFTIQDKDAAGHWMKCSVCGTIDETTRETHDFDHACDTTCDECGFTRTITHDYSVQDKDETSHWMKCSVCGEIDESTRETHKHDNACDTTCDGCGYVRTITHDYSVQDKNAETHWMKCSVCSVADETTREAHKHENTCDTDCNVCGQVREITHAYDNACDAECNVCKEIRQVPDHVYDNACDAECNECGATREVPDHVYDNNNDLTCNECGYERPPYTPGDLDGKEGVDMDDAIYLLFAINFPGSYDTNQPLDFDGSGVVDMDDAIYLLFHVNFPDDYPLH